MISDRLPRIVTVSPTQRIWIVRADDGLYLNNFIEHNVISIGHADILNLSAKRNIQVADKDLEKALSRAFSIRDTKNAEVPNYKPTTKAKITQDRRQISTFVNKMKVGDLVITPTRDTLTIGRIQTSAYLDSKPINYIRDESRNDVIRLTHNLRRDIKWMPTINRVLAPPALFPLLTGHSTVFELTQNKDEFYNVLYPIYVKNNNVHIAVSFNQKQKLKGFSVSLLGQFIARLEVIAKNPDLNFDDFNKLFYEYAQSDQIDFGDKAHYLSPGKAFYTVVGVGVSVGLICVGLHYFLKGGKIEIKATSYIEFKSDSEPLLTAEHMDKLLGIIAPIKKELYSDRIIEHLQPELDQLNTKALEGDVPDENNEKTDMLSNVG